MARGGKKADVAPVIYIHGGLFVMQIEYLLLLLPLVYPPCCRWDPESNHLVLRTFRPRHGSTTRDYVAAWRSGESILQLYEK